MNLKPIDIDEYCSKAEPVLGVFASKAWLSVYSDTLSFVGIFKDEKQLIGGFYFLKTKKLGFDFIKLPPYTPHCGLFYISDSRNKSSINNFHKEVLTEVSNFFSSLRPALTVLAFPSNITDLQPFIWKKYKVIPNYTYRIDLQQSLEAISANFDPKNRNMLNRVVKEEVEVRFNVLLPDQLFTFFRNSLLRAGANVYEKELENIFKTFSHFSNSFCVAAYKGAELLGAVFCVYDKVSCFYLLGGLSKENKINGVNNMLLYKSIENAKSLGCTVFDFEGSMLPGVEKFFRSFGPELVAFYTANKGLLPLELLLKFKKRELF